MELPLTASTFQTIDPIAAMREHGKMPPSKVKELFYFCILRMKKSSYVNLAAGNLCERVQMVMVRKAQAAKHLMTASSYAKTRRAKVFIFFQMRQILSQESCPRRI